MRHGVGDFVLKPWENNHLVTILRTQVEAGRLRRKIQRLQAESQTLAGELRNATNLKTMLKRAAERLRQALASDAVVIFTRALCESGYCATAKAGASEEACAGLQFDANSVLLASMTAPFDPRSTLLPEAETRKLDRIGSILLVPICVKDELVGFVSLSGKPCGDPYDDDEIKFLEAAGEQIGAAMNLLLFRQQEHEFEAAREIQRRLLPGTIPQIRGVEIAAEWRPASVVSGDYFDVLKFGDNDIGLCIADVSGKGMPAALLMSNVQATVKAFAAATISPAALCHKVNGVVSANIAGDKFITLFYCRIDAGNSRLVYSNAGHNAGILVRRDGTVERLERGGTVLGPFPDCDYEEVDIEVGSGDRVLLFTDGVTEVRNAADEEFGDERLIDLLIAGRGLTAAQIRQQVMAAVAEFSGGNFHDDATLIVALVE